MKRPIKFRGRATTLEVGKMVYGDLIQSGGEASIFDGTHRFYVDPNTVAQLVGYDKDGREIYEGDKVVSEYGDSVIARLVDNLPPKAKFKEAQS